MTHLSGEWGRSGDGVGIAVVGLGYWGPNLVRNVEELEVAELRAVCDVRPEALATIARRYPGVRATPNLDEILTDPTIDAVIVATPVTTHHSLAAAALDAGKHVLVEKPLAASAAAAHDLVQRADAAGLVLMPGHTFLYSPPVRLIRELIAGGELGDVFFVSTSRVNLGIHQPDVSVVWDLGPHDFSILRYWLDDTPTHVSAVSRDCVGSGTPDVAFINLEYASGTVANVQLSWLSPSKLRRTTVVGSRKMVVYDDISNEPVRVFDSGVNPPAPETFGEFRLTYRTGDIISPPVEPSEPLQLELADFCKSILQGTTPRSHAQLGLEIVELIESTEKSLAHSGNRVAVDRLEAPDQFPALSPLRSV